MIHQYFSFNSLLAQNGGWWRDTFWVECFCRGFVTGTDSKGRSIHPEDSPLWEMCPNPERHFAPGWSIWAETVRRWSMYRRTPASGVSQRREEGCGQGFIYKELHIPCVRESLHLEEGWKGVPATLDFLQHQVILNREKPNKITTCGEAFPGREGHYKSHECQKVSSHKHSLVHHPRISIRKRAYESSKYVKAFHCK